MAERPHFKSRTGPPKSLGRPCLTCTIDNPNPRISTSLSVTIRSSSTRAKWFEEVAELVSVCWLEIRGKIDTRLLSPSTMYKAYLVFKSTAAAYGFDYQPAEVSVGLIGGAEPTKQTAFLDADRGRTQSYQIVPGRVGIFHRSRILGLQVLSPM
ncbi:hypothetical protein ACLB2K_039338 [Fragaria x ananassa]